MEAPFTVADHIEFEKQHKSHQGKAKLYGLGAVFFLVPMVFWPIVLLVEIIEGRSNVYWIDMPLWMGLPIKVLLLLVMLYCFRKLSREENNLKGQARYYGLLAHFSAQKSEVLSTAYVFLRDLEALDPDVRTDVVALIEKIEAIDDEYDQRAVEDVKRRLEEPPLVEAP